MVQISDKFEPRFSKNPTSTNGNCWASQTHQNTNMKAALTQATFPLQCFCVSKLCVSRHAKISVLLLLSWQLENTQSWTPVLQQGVQTRRVLMQEAGGDFPALQHQGSSAGMLMACHLVGQLQSLVFQQSQAPGSLLATSILHAEGALTEALTFFSHSFTAGTLWCIQTFFFPQFNFREKVLVYYSKNCFSERLRKAQMLHSASSHQHAEVFVSIKRKF